MTEDREVVLRAELEEIGEERFRTKWVVTMSHLADHNADRLIALGLIQEFDRRDLKTHRIDVLRGTKWSALTALFTGLIALFTALLVVVGVMQCAGTGDVETAPTSSPVVDTAGAS